MKKTETEETQEGRRPKPGEFPRAITRSVFGRYYWPEAREAELRAVLQRSPQVTPRGVRKIAG